LFFLFLLIQFFSLDTGTRLQRAVFKRLPFTHCALSLLPFEDPVCTPDGIIFDLTHIVPYLKKHGVNPVTGKKLSSKELIPLKFSKDEKGNFRCPVTFKTFTPTSHIVAIRQTGNVYALEAVQELNLKTGHLKDLLTDERFQRKDIITLQETERRINEREEGVFPVILLAASSLKLTNVICD
uniref:RING-type E3 ubiquitin transferase n=1 Tax=Ascaris lumbricoides TaxID=6252 RepID=A0A0M3HIG3_ASCLU